MLARLLLLCAALTALLGACGPEPGWHARDVTGALPPLEFSMRRASDGVAVNRESYRGKVVLLYFGYTNCPDICPATLANLSQLLHRLGPKAANVRVLFLSVDPDRDSLPVLKAYTEAFAPQMDGLWGDENEIARVARRYRVAYSVEKPDANHGYEVSHSAAVFVFDRSGRARLVTMQTGDLAGLAADVTRLLTQEP